MVDMSHTDLRVRAFKTLVCVAAPVLFYLTFFYTKTAESYGIESWVYVTVVSLLTLPGVPFSLPSFVFDYEFGLADRDCGSVSEKVWFLLTSSDVRFAVWACLASVTVSGLAVLSV